MAKSDDNPNPDRRAAASQPAAADPVVADDPGKVMEPAAPSGAATEVPPGMAPPGQGAQVVLTGDAQAAARGGVHGEIAENTMARDQAILAGHVVEGTTAAAAADATDGGFDEIDALEAEDIAAARAKAHAARIARAAKKPA
jgi:hypothetical protein